jgi:hypothetical protein
MEWNWKELVELEQRIAKLSPAERLHLIERIGRQVRLDCFTDHAAFAEGIQQMAADPAIQNELDLWRAADEHAAR